VTSGWARTGERTSDFAVPSSRASPSRPPPFTIHRAVRFLWMNQPRRRTMSYAFRGENGPTGGKSGRTPVEVRDAGGFRPWQAASLADARANLRRLVQDGILQREAEAWCLSKNRENGWFFSTGLDATTAYDNYDYFYRFAIDGLAERPWNTIGANTPPGMALHLNADDFDAATMV